MALGILMILFISISVISLIGVAALWMSKSDKTKKIIYIGLVIWSVLLSILNFISLPSNFLFGRGISLFFGFVGILSLLFYKTGKKVPAYIIISLSVAASIIDTFFM
ncbi:hypothetical protein EXD82_09200 [Peptacetobacter hominis]|uniref:Uncharacterized protein n=1 Tax=Peptacetobacter hominis TaxID=2743610 RepID=A0A544QTF0_9FIRM|nr:hypothetical protein [Peptacetobacter hominis]TQQ83954.1 hypothetical protein EXD82_09200 [Peptacetobacter hominis]